MIRYFLFIFFTACAAVASPHGNKTRHHHHARNTNNTGCQATVEYFKKIYQMPEELLNSQNEDTDGEMLCKRTTNSCCNYKMQEFLIPKVKGRIDDFIREQKKNLLERVKSQKEQVEDLMNKTFQSASMFLHMKFLMSYGRYYYIRQEAFTEFYKELDEILKKDGDITVVFEKIARKIVNECFPAIIPNYKYSDEFKKCVSTDESHLVFSEFPRNVIKKVGNALQGPRRIYRSLNNLLDDLKESQKKDLDVSKKCYNKIFQLQFCSQCKGVITYKPCPDVCKSAASECLRKEREKLEVLTKEQEKEMKLIEENLMTDLNNILSTMLTEEFSFAVMDLERNKTVLKDAVFATCGTPEEIPNFDYEKYRRDFRANNSIPLPTTFVPKQPRQKRSADKEEHKKNKKERKNRHKKKDHKKRHHKKKDDDLQDDWRNADASDYEDDPTDYVDTSTPQRTPKKIEQDFENNRFKMALDRTMVFYKNLPTRWEVVEQSIYEEVMPSQGKSDHLCWNGTDEIVKNETIIVIEPHMMTTAAVTTETPSGDKHERKKNKNDYYEGDYNDGDDYKYDDNYDDNYEYDYSEDYEYEGEDYEEYEEDYEDDGDNVYKDDSNNDRYYVEDEDEYYSGEDGSGYASGYDENYGDDEDYNHSGEGEGGSSGAGEERTIEEEIEPGSSSNKVFVTSQLILLSVLFALLR